MVAPAIEKLPQRVPRSTPIPSVDLPRRIPGKHKYLFHEEIGSGGMGRVYLAAGPDGMRAVKEYFKPKGQVPDDDPFERQLNLAADAYLRLDHPDIARLHEVLPDRTLVMDYIDGDTLLSRVKNSENGRLTTPEAFALTGNVLDALMYMHEQEGVTHNDLKPANIIVYIDREAGREKGKVIDLDTAHSKDNPLIALMATPSFVAPELKRGAKPTDKSDIFSAGAVLYFALTGKLPFPVENPAKADLTTKSAFLRTEIIEDPMLNQLSDAIPLEESIGLDNMTPALWATKPLLESAMAQYSGDRPTAREFRDQLISIAAEYNVPMTGEVKLDKESPKPGRHRKREKRFSLSRLVHSRRKRDIASQARHPVDVRPERSASYESRHEKTVLLDARTEIIPIVDEKTQRIRLRGLRGLLQREQAPAEERIVTIYPPSEITTRPIDLRTGSLDSFEELRAFFDRRDVNGKKIKNPKGHPKSWGFLGRKHYDPQGRRLLIRTRVAAGGLSAAAVGTLASTWEAGMSALRMGLNFLGL